MYTLALVDVPNKAIKGFYTEATMPSGFIGTMYTIPKHWAVDDNNKSLLEFKDNTVKAKDGEYLNVAHQLEILDAIILKEQNLEDENKSDALRMKRAVIRQGKIVKTLPKKRKQFKELLGLLQANQSVYFHVSTSLPSDLKTFLTASNFLLDDSSYSPLQTIKKGTPFKLIVFAKSNKNFMHFWHIERIDFIPSYAHQQGYSNIAMKYTKTNPRRILGQNFFAIKGSIEQDITIGGLHSSKPNQFSIKLKKTKQYSSDSNIVAKALNYPFFIFYIG